MTKSRDPEHRPLEILDHATKLAAKVPFNGCLVGVTGGAGAGKSTLVRVLQAVGYPTVYPGQKVRSRFEPEVGMDKMAPEATEDFVREHVQYEFLTHRPRTVIVDGFPRSKDQVVWAREMVAKHGSYFGVVIVSAPVEDRRTRLRSRMSDWDAKLWEGRLADEAIKLTEFVGSLRSQGLDFLIEVSNADGA